MSNTLISSLVIIGLVWVSQSFRSIKFILEKGGTMLDFFKLSIFSMPAWLSISLSFGVFFGAFMTYTKLENERELIAMKSSGINSLQLSYPMILISFILSSFLFLNFHFLLPKSYSIYKSYEDNLRYKKPQILFNENSFFHIDKKTFFAQSIKGNELNKLFIKDYSSKQKTIDIFAKKALFIPEKNNLKIKLIDGIKIISEQKSNPLIINFKEDYISFNKNNKIKQTRSERVIDLKEFTYFELINKSKSYSKSTGIYLAEAHSRNVFSLTPIIFCMIFLSIFLRHQHSRYDNIFKKFVIISSVFFIQIMLFSMKNIVTKYNDYIYMFYLIPISLIIISFLIIKF
ncbi:LptF/LptG family permease, partial [Alphaproteobacteria bacterium]|nr:LptF/LptG family permease [Alphaproteobacteria bacterium]